MSRIRHYRFRIFRRKYLQPWWKDHQWQIIGGIAIFALALGYIGFKKYFGAIGETRSPLFILYVTFQLLVLESGAVSGPVSWELEVSKFLAPTVAAYAAVRALTVIFWEQLQLFRMRFIKNHVVICGLGQKGRLLAERFCERGYHVVVIEQHEKNAMLDQCKDAGAIVLIGDATSPQQLRKAHVHKAKHLISVCGDDGTNAKVAVHTRQLVRFRKGRVLTCIVHIVDPRLCQLLREKEIEAKELEYYRLDFFNIFDSGARSWLQDYSPFSAVGESNGPQPHLLVVGLGLFGESLVVHAAKEWKALPSKSQKKIRMTIIDKLANEKKESLCLRYPQLEKVCDLIPLQMDISSPDFQRGDFLFDDQKRCGISSVFICLDDDSSGLSAALNLHQHLREYKIPVTVRMTYDAGLATLLLERDEIDNSFAQLHAFGLLERACQPDLVLGGTYEILARAIHEDYRRKQREIGIAPQINSSIVPWSELPEHLKESNRRQADNIGVKLKAVGCYLEPLTDWDAGLFEFTPEEVELMAKIEHERWVSERRRTGWKYAPGEKNIKKRTSPHLIAWDKLSEEIRELDRNTVRELPSFLYKADFQICRLKKEEGQSV